MEKSNPPYVFFRIASAFGEEIFSLMPALFWYGFPYIALPFSTNFLLVILTGQYLKDVICIPRPDVKKSKIIRLESHFETEYGMPSTHSASGMMPFAILLALQRHYPEYHDSMHWSVYPFFAFMSLSVGVSRLYMGVHSIPDVVVGLTLGLIGVLALHFVGDIFDEFVYKHSYGWVFAAASLLWFTLLYPKSRPWSAAWGTASQIYGTWFGVALSCWFIFNVPSMNWIAARLASNAKRVHNAQTVILELVVAASIAGTAKVGSKAVAQSFTLWLVKRGIVKPHPKERVNVMGRQVPLNKLYCVEVPTRIFGYAFLAFSVVVLTPMAWEKLGIH